MLLALGVNGVLSGSISHYDPTYVDVAAVAVVAWFEGLLPALLAGTAAVTAWELWFSPARPTVRSLALPSVAALVAIAVVTLIRRLTRVRRIAERPGLPAARTTESRAPQEPPSLFTRELDSRGRAAESEDADRLRAEREARLQEELARAASERDALQSSMQAALLRHTAESSALKVERARAAEEARQAVEALSSATETRARLEAELSAARRAAEEARQLAEERDAAMLEGETSHGAEETRLRDALEQEKERVQRAASKIDSLAHDLALASVDRDRWQRTTTELRHDAQRRIQELADQSAAASAAAEAATAEVEKERNRSALAWKTIAELEKTAERSRDELAAARAAAEGSAAERKRLEDDLGAATLESDRWREEHSRSSDDLAQATASLTDLSLMRAEMEQLRLKHDDVRASLGQASAEADRLRGEHADVTRQLAAATGALTEIGVLRSEAGELRAENESFRRLLQLARGDADRAETTSARLTEELEGLAALQSEVARLDDAHAAAARLLAEARADAETARLDGEGIARELTRATAALTELSAAQAEAEELRAGQAILRRQLEESEAEAGLAREEAGRLGEQLAHTALELEQLSAVQSEAERLRAELGNAGRLLEEAHTDALDARRDALRKDEELEEAARRLATFSTVQSEAEALRLEHADVSRMLDEARAAEAIAREEAGRTGQELARAVASLADLSALQSESEQLRTDKTALLHAVESLTSERDAAQARAAMAATELGSAAQTATALTETRGIVEQLRSENRRLAAAVSTAGREAARLQADSTHYADEVIGLRARLERVSAASPETEGLRAEVVRLAGELVVARDRSDSLEKQRLVSEELGRNDQSRLAAELEEERKNLREALEGAARIHVELTARKEESERWQAETQRLMAEHETSLRSARDEVARSIEYERQARARLEADWAAKLEAEAARSTALEREIAERDSIVSEVRSQVQSSTREIGRLREQLAAADAAQATHAEEEQMRETMTAAVAASASSAAMQVIQLERESTRLREEVAAAVRESTETRAELDNQHQLFANAEKAWDEKLRHIVEGMTADHENDLGEAMIEREGAKAELRVATNQIAQLEAQLSRAAADLANTEKESRETQAALQALHKTVAESETVWSDKMLHIVTGMTTDHENALGEAMIEREGAKAELRSATNQIARLESEVSGLAADLDLARKETGKASAALEEQRQALVAAEKGWDEKMLRIVEGMTTDHENDLGEAMIEREGAKAELRSATNQIARLESALRAAAAARGDAEQEWKRRSEQVLAAIIERETTIRGAAEKEVARLRVELEARSASYETLAATAAEAKRHHDEAETSWGSKLQQIVANVTDDYEADLGEAIMSREAARAEVRSLSIDLRNVRQRLADAAETERALVAEAARREAEIGQLAASSAGIAESAKSSDEGDALQKKLHQAEQINSAWGDAFNERESELRREAARQLSDMQSQLERLRKSEAGVTEAFRAAAADAESLKRRLDEERVEAERKAAERDEVFARELLHAQQEWEDRFDAVVAEAEQKRQQLRLQIEMQEGELATLRAQDLELRARREQAETEELQMARQIELSRQSDEERRARSEVLQFAEDARTLLMGGSPEVLPAAAEIDPFPEAAGEPTASAESEVAEGSTASDDFLAIVTRLGGNS
jgi:chromosome segregation ATPase